MLTPSNSQPTAQNIKLIKCNQASAHVGAPGQFEDYPELLTVSHIAKLTGLSEQTIRKTINDGGLPGVKIGRRFFVPRVRFIEFLNEGAKQ